MSAVAVLLWVSTFSSFSWGVLHFFRKTAGLSWRTGIVGGLGLVFGVWHGFVVATAAAGTLRLFASSGLLAVSLALFWAAVDACARRRLTAIFEKDVPLFLIERGPYRFMRHPFYTSYVIFWFAGAIASASWLALASAVVMLATYVDAARREERKFATSPLAEEYADYRRRTRLV